MQIDVATGEHEDAAPGRAASATSSFNTADRIALGPAPSQRLRRRWCACPRPTTNWTQIHTFPYGEVPFDLDISPDGELLSTSVGEVNGDQTVRVFRSPICAPATPTTSPDFELRHSRCRKASSSRRTAAISTAAPITPASRTSIASRSPPSKIEAVSNAVTGFFRPIPRADGSLIVFEYTGQGFTPAIIDPKPLEDLGAIKFLGTEVADAHPVVKTWQVAPAKRGRRTIAGEGDAALRPLAEMQLSTALSRRGGLQRPPAVGWHAQLEDPLLCPARHTASYTPGQQPAGQRALPRLRRRPLPRLARRPGKRRANFYDLFGPTERSRKGDAPSLGYIRVPDLRSAGGARSPTTRRVLRRARYAARGAERRNGVRRLSTRRVQARLHQRPTVARRVDDEKGVTWAVATGHRMEDSTMHAATRGRHRLRLPAAAGRIPRSGSTRRRESPAAIATIRSLTSISAASATTSSTTARSNATASTTPCPASTSTRSAAATS